MGVLKEKKGPVAHASPVFPDRHEPPGILDRHEPPGILGSYGAILRITVFCAIEPSSVMVIVRE